MEKTYTLLGFDGLGVGTVWATHVVRKEDAFWFYVGDNAVATSWYGYRDTATGSTVLFSDGLIQRRRQLEDEPEMERARR